MKIAILSTFHPYRGGIAQFNACLYRELKRRGVEVVAFNFSRQYPGILFPGKTQFVSDKDTADNIPNHRILDSINFLSWQKTVVNIAQQKPDMVLLRYWTPFLAPALGYVAGKLKKQGIQVIAITDNIVPHERKFWDGFLSSYFLKRIDGYIAMTKEVENQIKSILPSLEGIVMPHPVYDHFGAKPNQDSARRQLNIPIDRKVILFFGLIRDYKGLDLLIEAFGMLDSSYHLVIAGESYGDFQKYDDAIQKSVFKENISVFNRYIDDSEVPAFFALADVVVLPYRSATQSGITAISFHFGVPVIATNVGGLSEVIEHGYNGLLSESSTAQGIADQIKHFFTSDIQTELSQNVKRSSEKLSWIGFVEALLKFSVSIK